MEKSFSEKKLNIIKKSIDTALENGAAPIAAFDADGTIWDTDVGEHFFFYQIKNNLLENLPKNTIEYYHQLCQIDARKAFLWLVQINQSKTPQEIKNWTFTSLKDFSTFPIFKSIVSLLNFLHDRKVKIYIVTASMQWVVEATIEYLKLPPATVIGMRTKLKDGKLTEELDGIITWQEGKAEKLLQSTQPKYPFFCAGNTMGDLALLQSATHIRMANCALPKEHLIYESERNLLNHAIKNQWFYHDYTENY